MGVMRERRAEPPARRNRPQGNAKEMVSYGAVRPAAAPAGEEEGAFLTFFQTNEDTGARKGIAALDLGGYHDKE